MNKRKYTYQSYDYTFLYTGSKLPLFQKVFAKTTGFVLTTVQPMNEPRGTLYFTDPIMTTDAPQTNEGINQRILEASNEIARRSSTHTSNYAITSASVYRGIKNAETRKINKERFFARRNFFKNLRNSKYGKKI